MKRLLPSKPTCETVTFCSALNPSDFAVEALTREPILQKEASPHFYHYELIEMTVLISMEKSIAEKTELDDINLTYIQGLRAIKVLTQLCRVFTCLIGNIEYL